ncbi:hypothetical protein F2P56_010358 [Juglans regia]|uniref:Disease resistance N-terminal domain-containing protein n=1 Tax=Juglans regia TaxID=51240 RepID=A0A833XQ16_JUGRE|nr:hypothetical protein F2P56_010358 [Juglans regia]
MAEVGLAFLSASLSVLFDRMASPEVVGFMQGRKPTEVLLRNLKNAMRSVKFVLEDAEEKQHTDSFVKGWVDDLKDVIYDAEDILDEIATEALQRKLDAESSTTALEKVFVQGGMNMRMLSSSNNSSPTNIINKFITGKVDLIPEK